MHQNVSLAVDPLSEMTTYLQENGYAPRTVMAYQKDLKSWLSWAESHQVPFNSLSQENVQKHLKESGVKTESNARRRIAALIALSQSTRSCACERPSFSFLDGIELIKPTRGRNLSHRELELIVESIRGYKKQVSPDYIAFRVDRDVAFVTLAHFGKLRVSQLLDLEVSDFSATKEGDTYGVIVRDSKLTVPGDYYEIQTYPERRKKYQSLVKGISEKLFINQSGESMDPRSMRRNVAGYLKSANLQITGIDGLRAK